MTEKRRLKKKIAVSVFAVIAALSLLLLASGCGKYKLFVPPARDLPVSEEFALEQYDAEELGDVRATLRADTMYVTERNVERPVPEILNDSYSLVYDETENKVLPYYEKRTGKNTATIDFVRYPYPGGAGGGDGSADVFRNAYAQQAYDMFGIGASASDSDKQQARNNYYYYYKYMLMSQGYNLAAEAQNRSANGTLTQDWLKKHPAADLQYGEVIGTDNAVEKVIILDSLYRSYHATGLYLPAGEAVTVKVEGLAAGEAISISIGLNNSLAWRGSGYDSAKATGFLNEMAQPSKDSTGKGPALKGMGTEAFFVKADALTAGGHFFDFGSSFVQSQWNRQNNRAPWITADFVFNHNGTYTIGTHFGGIMHINPRNCYSQVKTTIRGAVETPHYILGVTTPEYYETYLVDRETAPGVYAVIDTENGQLIGRADYMRRNTKPEEVEKLAYLWHSFFSVNESFTGGTYNRRNLVQFDQHVPAGAAVALGGYVYACPTSWFNSATNYRSLLNSGSWGILHEIGHNHSSAYGTVWGMGGGQEGEVRNNALICLAYLKFCDLGTYINESNGSVPAEHGFVAHPYSSLANTLNIMKNSSATDFNNLGYFDALNIYTNIMHSFGVDKFYELLYSYKNNPSYNPRTENNKTAGNKRSDFIYRLSTIYGMNFRPYVDGIFKGNTDDSYYYQEQLDAMEALPVYHPVANLYAGGIDGVKTGGDYRIVYGTDKVFDLKGKTITTAEGFEIVKVLKPEHGKITDMGDGKYKYTFNSKYSGNTDSFSFDVKLSDGVCHRLTVYLRFNFNGSRVSDYGAVDTADLDKEEELLSDKQPVQVFSSSYPGLVNYTSQSKYEMRVAKFWYKAPESGEFTFSATADDKVNVYFGESFDDMEKKITIGQYIGSYSDANSFKVTLKKDKYYAFKVVNMNAGGKGGAMLGVKSGDETAYVNVPSPQLVFPEISDPASVKEYVFEPQLLVSKKDNALAATMNTDKSEWKVLAAPEDLTGNNGKIGRYETEQMVDEETGDVTDFTVDRWSWLIDGQTGTMLHTSWEDRHKPTPATDAAPDIIVIDTQREQSFNYFTISTRNRSDSFIKRYELQVASKCSYDERTGQWEGDFKKIAEGTEKTPLAFSKGVASITFPQVRGRYLKLIIKETSAANSKFTVIGEIDAGTKTSLQMVYPSTSMKYYYSKGWKETSVNDEKEQRSGLMWAEKKNAKLVIKIKTSTIALYSDKGVGFGSAKIKLDGKLIETVSLESDTSESRKLVFYAEGLKEKKEHTVEIITTSNKPFNLDFVGATYNSTLVNAPNIYVERGLTISLVIFILLFLLAAAALCVIYFVPAVRAKVFKNDVVAMNPKGKKPVKKADAKTAAKPSNRASAIVAARMAASEKAQPATSKTDGKAASKTSVQSKAPLRTSGSTQSKPTTSAKSSAPTKSTVAQKTTVNSTAAKTQTAKPISRATGTAQTKTAAKTETKNNRK